MSKSSKRFSFEYSYLSLPDRFYSFVKPQTSGFPQLVLMNRTLFQDLCMVPENPDEVVSLFLPNETAENKSFAQAYAGHQFGHFTMLGDGRAVVVGEQVTTQGKRFDIQLKGSGRTPYSRNGDGKATLKAMLREYLMSEAMHHLKIPTSRSLAVVKTGEQVHRETANEGAMLARVMTSHIRVGTFEYAAWFCSPADLQALLLYTIKRLFPEIEHEENPAISLLTKVMERHIDLVVQWMRVGFIHGVMNTDNVAISGETFDYGPCAFMNTYDPDTVFSSIDTQGRYAFGNQPRILQWNMVRFAEALLPVIHPNREKAIEQAQSAIDGFRKIWNEKYYSVMLNKIGIDSKNPELFGLVDDLLDLMKRLKLDYTNTFLALRDDIAIEDNPLNHIEFAPWLERRKSVFRHSIGFERSMELLRESNPVYIPRNHVVEKALDEAVQGNFSSFENLLAVLEHPYDYQSDNGKFMTLPDSGFEFGYKTFCGT